MTIEEARRVAELLVTMDDAVEFREAFEADEHPFILFEEVCTAGNIRGDGNKGGWEGPIRMHRETAIEMMAWLEAKAAAHLASLSVAGEKV